MEKELQKIYDSLRKDKDFADLSDNEILEMAEMELKAKGIKNYVSSDEKMAKEKKPRTHKTSDAKIELFEDILTFLQNTYEDVRILKENKLIEVIFDEKTFKIDLIEQRPKKS